MSATDNRASHPRGGTLALSWGRNGGFYLHRNRVCLGWVALTWLPYEIDDLMEWAALRTTT